MSKLAIFLLNLAKIGLLDFWTPLVLEFDFFDENKQKNVEIRPFLSKLAWKIFLSYEPVKINFRGACFFETTRQFITIPFNYSLVFTWTFVSFSIIFNKMVIFGQNQIGQRFQFHETSWWKNCRKIFIKINFKVGYSDSSVFFCPLFISSVLSVEAFRMR